MEILFSVGEIENDYNANTKIVLQIAEKLAFFGHDCCVAGVHNGDTKKSSTQNAITIERLPAIRPVVRSSVKFENFLKENNLNRNDARNLFVKKHPVSSAFVFLRYTSFYREKIEQPRYLKQIKKLVKKTKPDAIICVYKPINSFETVMNSDIDVPKFAYQLDPWGLHRLDNKDENIDIIKKETDIFEKAEHIFTTPILAKQYDKNNNYKKFLPKMTELEFPNIKRYKNLGKDSAIDFDRNYINILFCGVVADEYRDPEYLLVNMAQLFCEKIRLYFIGTNNSSILDKYMSKYPDNIFFVDKVSMDSAFSTMEKADILVNISNSVDNQVPSKIFDYFSMCKPIINVQKIGNCPCEEYFEKYPLVFNMKEFEKTDINNLRDFIFTSVNQEVKFEDIEKIYHKATVYYVAEQIENALKNNI